ncbi:MAG: glycosyltransferase family 4 protein [Propionibacteriaceae bacterium]|jgi:glycosyltransferase involved in cell wall biosynthesis|nr:glycosyltransferase family 4 protein [Propionibacteriaceae bacterium]
MESLRIGLFTDDFFPESGGIGRSLQAQLAELTKAGHDVTLFAPRAHFHAPEIGKYMKLNNVRIPGTPSYLNILWPSLGRVRKLAKEYPLDIVHTQNERGSAYVGRALAHLMDVPHVHTFHTNFPGMHESRPFAAFLVSALYLNGLAPLLLKQVFPGDLGVKLRRSSLPPSIGSRDFRALARFAAQTSAFTSPAAFIAESIVKASGGVLADRAHVVPNGYYDSFHQAVRKRPRNGVVRFLSSGRLDPEKRVDAVIEAYEHLADENTELVIVGDGQQFSTLKRRAAEITTGRILFTGHIGDLGKLSQEMADADVFILASYHYDVQPMVLLEAAAAGVPILYCDERLTTGVTPQNALMTDPSIESLAAGMAVLAADAVRREEMGAAGRELAQSLTAAKMAELYVSVYRDAIERHPRKLGA